MLDESKVASACVGNNADPAILVSLIKCVNDSYVQIKRGEAKQKNFEELLTAALSSHEGIDLFNFKDYKKALGCYYGRKRSPVTQTPFKQFVEITTYRSARIRVSPGVSMIFAALNEKGPLGKTGLTHSHCVIHTVRDVKDSEVRVAAQALARKAINSLRRPIPKRRRKKVA